MRQSRAFDNRKKAYKIICFQLVAAVVVSSFYVFFVGKSAAYSALLGGLVCALPNAAFARYFFSRTGAQQSREIMMALFKGEAMKIALTVILFILIIKYTAAQPLPVLVGFVINQLTFWFAPLILKT